MQLNVIELGFILLSLFLTGGLAYIIASWKISFALFTWCTLTASLAITGVTTDFTAQPSPVLLILVSGLFLTFVLAFSPYGLPLARLSIGFLVGFSAYRIIVEALIHQAVVEGIAPPQMTWSGLNYDIIAGVTALLLAPFATKLPTSILVTWNTIALGLILWTVSIGLRSLPTPLQEFEPVGLWVTQFPYTWLPSVLAPFAVLSHLVIYRKLLSKYYN